MENGLYEKGFYKRNATFAKFKPEIPRIAKLFGIPADTIIEAITNDESRRLFKRKILSKYHTNRSGNDPNDQVRETIFKMINTALDLKK